jgi:FimV-like protein
MNSIVVFNKKNTLFTRKVNMSFQYQVQQTIQTLMTNINALVPYIKHYQPLITSSGILLVTLLLLKIIRRKQQQSATLAANTTYQPKQTLSSKDIEMVAGDDVVTTQLDLARAYMEMGKKNLAKSILYHVSKQGQPDQQQEARRLISTLE